MPSALDCHCPESEKRGADHEDELRPPCSPYPFWRASPRLQAPPPTRRAFGPILTATIAAAKVSNGFISQMSAPVAPGSGAFGYAAFLRFASRRASTNATMASMVGCWSPFCLAISCTSLSARFDIRRAVIESTRRGSRPRQASAPPPHIFQRNEIAWRGAQLNAQIVDEVVDRTRRLDVAVHGFLGGTHPILSHAAIVAGPVASPIWRAARKSDRAPAA